MTAIRHQSWRRHRHRRPKEEVVGPGGSVGVWSWEDRRFGKLNEDLKQISIIFFDEFLEFPRFTELRTSIEHFRIGSVYWIDFAIFKKKEKLTISNPFWVWGWRWAWRFNYVNSSNSGIYSHPIIFNTSTYYILGLQNEVMKIVDPRYFTSHWIDSGEHV